MDQPGAWNTATRRAALPVVHQSTQIKGKRGVLRGPGATFGCGLLAYTHHSTTGTNPASKSMQRGSDTRDRSEMRQAKGRQTGRGGCNGLAMIGHAYSCRGGSVCETPRADTTSHHSKDTPSGPPLPTAGTAYGSGLPLFHHPHLLSCVIVVVVPSASRRRPGTSTSRTTRPSQGNSQLLSN